MAYLPMNNGGSAVVEQLATVENIGSYTFQDDYAYVQVCTIFYSDASYKYGNGSYTLNGNSVTSSGWNNWNVATLSALIENVKSGDVLAINYPSSSTNRVRFSTILGIK